MNGSTYRFRVFSIGSNSDGHQRLADRKGLSWEAACECLKSMGPDLVVATIHDEQTGFQLMRCQPTGMFGLLILEDVRP